MISAKPLALMCLYPMMFTLPGCAPFVSEPPIAASQSACSSLLPDEWREGVPGAVLPGTTTADWIAFGDAQTAQLDKANDRTKAAIGIVERCEERDRAAVKKTRRKVLGVF